MVDGITRLYRRFARSGASVGPVSQKSWNLATEERNRAGGGRGGSTFVACREGHGFGSAAHVPWRSPMSRVLEPAEPLRLPPECEQALFERFLKAEAMALWAVRSAQLQDVPPNVQTFLRTHEEDERNHLGQFEALAGHPAHGRSRLPAVPRQWPVLAVQLYGYESLGLEFARLLVVLRPDLAVILADEEAHVGFFEREILRLLAGGGTGAEQARRSARAWWRRLPRTLNRYLEASALDAVRPAVAAQILTAIEQRLSRAGLLALSPSHGDGGLG